jgi:acyl-CoA synthetase (AMP-forming)/AMP-acid ligase II
MPVPINELRDLARRHLAAYKIPRIFEVRESLPRSPTGKILRHLLETG